MAQTSKLITAIGAALLLGLGAIAWYKSHPKLWPEFGEGQALIAEVEIFRKQNGRLPSELEIGAADERGPVHYQRISETAYQVWFGRELGESYLYDSSHGVWR